ncbi:MAG: hypothetical protein LBQ61_01030 [Spirochaetales bacterium]|jgi:hypothetical protein|nr:hypothetical protein [Spirochaetales bacterium]
MKLAAIILGLDIILLCLIYLLLRRRIDRFLRPDHILSELESEVDRVITELNQTTDRNINLIEDRIGKLYGLLEEGDKRILLLQKEGEKFLRSAEQTSSPLSLKIRRVEESPPGEAPFPASPVSSVPPPPASVGFRRKIREPSPPVYSRPLPVQGREQTTKEKVLQMNREGKKPDEIALGLKLSLSEVEMILSLGQ